MELVYLVILGWAFVQVRAILGQVIRFGLLLFIVGSASSYLIFGADAFPKIEAFVLKVLSIWP